MVSRAFVLGQPSGPLHVFIAFLDSKTNYRAMHVMLAGIVYRCIILYTFIRHGMLWYYGFGADRMHCTVHSTRACNIHIYIEMEIIFIKLVNSISRAGREKEKGYADNKRYRRAMPRSYTSLYTAENIVMRLRKRTLYVI